MKEGLVLITGATSDIGRPLVRRLLEQGHQVIATGHKSLHLLTQELGEPSQLFPLVCDLRSATAIQELRAHIRAEIGIPSSFVFLAASPLKYRRFKELTWADLNGELQMQIEAPLLLLQYFLPELRKQKLRGRVLFMLSSVVLDPPANNLLHYTVAKSALMAMMRGLAVEYSDGQITFNALSPSLVETRFLQNVPSKLIEISAAKHPMGRNATPADVLGAIEFLLSDGSGYINGVNLPITGGSAF